MGIESPKKEKSRGKEARLRDIGARMAELRAKKERHWINEEEFKRQLDLLEEERLEVLTDPNSI